MTRMPDAVEVDVGAGLGVEGARRATGGPDPATTLPGRAPDPEVEATVQRRRPSPSPNPTRFRRSYVTSGIGFTGTPTELADANTECRCANAPWRF